MRRSAGAGARAGVREDTHDLLEMFLAEESIVNLNGSRLSLRHVDGEGRVGARAAEGVVYGQRERTRLYDGRMIDVGTAILAYIGDRGAR